MPATAKQPQDEPLSDLEAFRLQVLSDFDRLSPLETADIIGRINHMLRQEENNADS